MSSKKKSLPFWYCKAKPISKPYFQTTGITDFSHCYEGQDVMPKRPLVSSHMMTEIIKKLQGVAAGRARH